MLIGPAPLSIRVVAILLALGGTLGAQAVRQLDGVPHPRVALVLSGGSAKGLADIGAIEMIEEMGIPIDVVTGTSMGSVIGGLYAAGYSPAAIESLLTTEDWSTFFKRPDDRRLQRMYERLDDQRFTLTFPLERARPILPAAVVSRQSIATYLERRLWPVSGITDFMQLPTPFAALATDLGTGAPVLLQSGSLAEAIEGSSAVPGVFAPLTLADGRTVVDGAVNRNIPAEDARAVGADILICVDVSEQVSPVQNLRSLVDILDQTVAFRVQMSNVVELPLCNVVISPDITELSSVDFAQWPEWVRRGRAAALAQHAALRAVADSVRAMRGATAPRRTLPRIDSVFIGRVSRSAVSAGADVIARGAISLRDSTWVTQPQVEAVAARVFATGRFDQVSYRLTPHRGANELTFDLAEGERDVLGVGVRYDTPHGVALLASANIADVLSAGSTASLTARLGAIQQFDARDVLGESVNAPFLQTYHATWTRMTLPSVLAPGATGAPTLRVYDVAAHVERTLPVGITLGGDLTHEWSSDGATNGPVPFAPHRQSVNVLGVTISRDNRDRLISPTRGTAITWQSEIAGPTIGSAASYSRHLIEAEGAFPVSRVSLLGGGQWGTAHGNDLPLHDWFFLGGSIRPDVMSSQFVPFLGLDPESVAGQSVRVLEGGAQTEGPSGVTIALRGNIGNVFDTSPATVVAPGYQRGVGLTLTTELAPGPLSITIAGRSWRRPPVIEVGFGARF
jgi:NTE family protein